MFSGILNVQYFERIEMIFYIKYCGNERVTRSHPFIKLNLYS